MIGKLPDTLEDRSIVVPLRRKQKGETVARFRADKLGEYLPLRRRAQRWADDNMARLRGMDPDVPDDLNDRADRKSTRLNSSHVVISYAVFCLKKKNSSQHPNSYAAFSLQ